MYSRYSLQEEMHKHNDTLLNETGAPVAFPSANDSRFRYSSATLNIHGAASSISAASGHGSGASSPLGSSPTSFPTGGMSDDLSFIDAPFARPGIAQKHSDPVPALGGARMMPMGQQLPKPIAFPNFGGQRSTGSSLSATAAEFHLNRSSSPPSAIHIPGRVSSEFLLGRDSYDFNALSVGGNSPVIGGGNTGILGAFPGLGGPIGGIGLGHPMIGSDYGGMGGSVRGGSSNDLSSLHSRGGSPVNNYSPDPPCGIRITAETDPLRAAGTLALVLSQWAMLPGISGIPNCAIYLDGGVPSDQMKLIAAARTAIGASFLSHVALSSATSSSLGSQSPPGQSRRPPSLSDLALVPLLVSDGSVSLLSVSVPPLPAAVWQSSAQQMFAGQGGSSFIIEPGSNPLTKGIEACLAMKGGLSGGQEGGAAQAIDILFDGDEALMALQSVAVARINFINGDVANGRPLNGDDLLILPIRAGGDEDDSWSRGKSDRQRYHLRLVPASHVMSAAQMAELNCIIQDAQKTNELLLVSQGLDSSRLVGGRVRHLEGSEGRGEETPKLVYSPLQSMGKPLDFSLPPPHPHLSNGHPYQQQHQPSAIPSGSSQLRMNQPHHFSPSQHSHQDQPLLPPPYNQALNHNHVPRNLPSTSQANVPGGAQRKADYVIVTEDTAVKNAAGAIAKVLGRVCGQGLCCPVFTERKTDHLTGVISVAVKAIAVARGYVANEESGCQVSFQPYLRQASSLLGMATSTAGSSHQMMMMMGGVEDLAGPQSFSRRSAPVASSSVTDLFSQGQGHMMQGHLPGVNQAGLTNDLNYRAALIKSSENIDVSPSLASSADENSELAFDVFKVPPGLLPPEPDDGNLPVKVTAHSRAAVVSNIITKLVVERGSVVLITAGGRAMHVAMLAVVSARAKLRATLMSAGGTRGGGGVPDVLLIPKFVTVDTTSSLGWESVFLRFHIVSAPETLLGSELPQLQQLQQQQASSQPSAIAIAAAAASARQQQQLALQGSLYPDRSLGGSPPVPPVPTPQSLDTELLIRMMINMNSQQ